MGLDISNNTIDLYFHQLTKEGFLVKLCKGKYMLNPKYFFKGTLNDSAKMTITFECKE